MSASRWLSLAVIPAVAFAVWGVASSQDVSAAPEATSATPSPQDIAAGAAVSDYAVPDHAVANQGVSGKAAPRTLQAAAGKHGEGLPFYTDAAFTPHWAGSEERLPNDFHRVPAFALTNQHNQPISEQTFAGKVYVTNFFFTTCRGICSKMTKNLLRVQEAFNEDERVALLSHSVTPDVDTPAVLKQYATTYGCRAGKWQLATGEQDAIYALGRNGYFVEEDQGRERDNAFLHSENFILVDTNRRLRGIYNGLNRTDVDRLIEDIRSLLAE